MASKVPEYLIQIFEEAIANNNYDVDDLFEKVLEVKRTTIRSKKESNWVNYSVDDSSGTHLALIDANDNTVSYIVFGRSKTDWAHNIVRLRGENES